MPELIRLLVGDDDEILLQSIRRFFLDSGSFEVTTVHSIREVHNIMIPARFDAVILGFDLRQSTGALEKIRSNGDMTPVILFSKEEPGEAAIKTLHFGSSLLQVKGNHPESKFGTLYSAVQELVQQENEIRVLRESEARYRDLFENAPDMYLSVDASTGVVVDCNNAVVVQTGYSKEEIIGREVLLLYCPGSFEAARQAFCQFKTTGIVRNAKLQVKRKDGSTLDVLLNATAVRDRQGKILFSRSVWSDITMYRQVRKKLRESEERFRLLYEAAPLGYQSLDSEGRIIEVNKAWLDTFGYSREDVIGHWFGEFLEPEDREKFRTIFPGYISEGGHHSMEFSMIKKDGSRIIVSFEGNIGHDREGKFLQTHSILSNITARKRAEEALMLTGRKLALMSSITRHDILNQLGLLDGYLSLAEKSVGDPVNFNRFMNKVHMAVLAIQRQITFTRLYQELGMKAPGWISVNDCIEQSRALLPAGTIKIINLSDRIEVYADPLFEKIFNNLIDNALRYGGESMTLIRFSVVKKGDGLGIICEDNGAGMTAEEKEHLFERGYGKHTGLGLFLSKEILSITGMTIEETSIPGHGARFEITVPAGGFRYTG